MKKQKYQVPVALTVEAESYDEAESIANRFMNDAIEETAHSTPDERVQDWDFTAKQIIRGE